jgi:aminopeptidase-like protein
MLADARLNRSYRFLFVPETIGALTWLSQNEKRLHTINSGLIATCVGDRGISTYQRSRDGNTLIDRVVEKVLQDSGEPYQIRDFIPYGSDERQYSSPGFNLPIGSLMRTPYGEPEFPEYHTSGDNLDFIDPRSLGNSLKKYLHIIYILEKDRIYLNTNPKGEPQLGRRNLYNLLGGQREGNLEQYALLWTLNLSDGKHSLLDISRRSKMPFRTIADAADRLVASRLLVPSEGIAR